MKAVFTVFVITAFFIGLQSVSSAQNLPKVSLTVILEGKEIIDAAAKLIDDHYDGKIKPIIKAVPRNWSVPLGKREFRLVIQGKSQEFLPNGVEIIIKGKRYSTLSLGQYITYKLEAPVSQVDIKPNQLLTDQNVKSCEIQMPAGDKLPPKLEEVIGKAAAVRIMPDRVVRESMLMEPFTVLRGDSLSVRIIRGLITLEVPGQALQNGRIGDRINVKLTNKNRIIAGKIVDVGLVVLEVSNND